MYAAWLYRLLCLSCRIDGLLQIRLDWIWSLILIRGVFIELAQPLWPALHHRSEGLFWNNIHTCKPWPVFSPRMCWQVLVVFACLLTIATACIPQNNSSATLWLVRLIFYLHALSPWAQFSAITIPCSYSFRSLKMVYNFFYTQHNYSVYNIITIVSNYIPYLHDLPSHTWMACTGRSLDLVPCRVPRGVLNSNHWLWLILSLFLRWRSRIGGEEHCVW
jgi:hypothetical protein